MDDTIPDIDEFDASEFDVDDRKSYPFDAADACSLGGYFSGNFRTKTKPLTRANRR